MTIITNLPFRWLLCALWTSLALLGFLAADSWAMRSWLALAVVGLVPPVVLLRLWTDGPPPTIAEVLLDTERRP
jgi:hypothetical protein